MKFRGLCEYPANERGIYVEASSEDEARDKMTNIIMAIYGCDKEQVSIYNIFSELDNPEGVLNFETAWSGDGVLAWDDDPIIAYKSNSQAMREWCNKPILQKDQANA